MLSPRLPFLSQNRLFIFFTAVCVAVNILAYVLYTHHRDILRSQEWVTHTYQVNHHAQSLVAKLYLLNSHHKNYLLTGNGKTLEDFKSAKRDFDIEQTFIRRMVNDNPSQIVNIKKIGVDADALYTAMRQQASRRGGNLSQIVVANQELVNALRARIDSFMGNEKALLKERTRTVESKQQSFLQILIVSSGLSFLGLFVTIIALVTMKGHQREAEADLASSQEHLKLVMQGLNDGIFDYNVEKNGFHFSTRFKEMLGYRDKELADSYQNFQELVHPDDLENALAAQERYFRKELPIYVNYFRMRHKDGRYRWLMARGQGVWNDHGRIRRLVGAVTDITEQKTVEEHLRNSKDELENFTYIASHDLRSPLVNLKGFASEMAASLAEAVPAMERSFQMIPSEDLQIMKTALTEDIPEALHYIQTAVSKMDKLTNAILDLQRIGKRRLRYEPIDTQEMARRCLDVLAHEIQTKGITVELGAMPEIISDPIAFEQVLSNLLDNAVKYLDPKRPGRIAISGRRQHGESLFEVTDNGRGIAAAEQDKVFEFFRRASNTSDIRGEGMGMAFVKSIVNRLGGRIWFQSTPGQGTSFYFTVNEEIAND